MTKKLSCIGLAIGLTLLAIYVSYRKSDGDLVHPSFLTDAQNLARQTGGFYVKLGQVSVKKSIENDQHKLELALSDPTIKPHTLNIFFEDEAWRDVELASGQYELLFLQNALIINDPVTGKKREFVVHNRQFEKMTAKLPDAYLSKSAIQAIGIGVSWNRDLVTIQ
jgi:hypothetical protein